MTTYVADKEKKYISDVIGWEYERWSCGDIILITAPTGSGKSHFILHNFLMRAIRNGERVLYLVNRRVLKKQLEEELKDIDLELKLQPGWENFIGVENYISIDLYQSIEVGLKNRKIVETIKWLKRFSCVVCDECHYFYMDSLFNTNTELSYDCIRREFDGKIQIYMSATMKNMREIIRTRTPLRIPETLFADPAVVTYRGGKRFHEYNTEVDYSYVQLKYFEDEEHLSKVIQKGININKAKWLIFVDSIEKGKSLRTELVKSKDDDHESSITEGDIVFVDADYKRNEDAFQSVNEIAKDKCFKQKVLISTSVMDNGVSFHDQELRNIVILADTPETFIQMLGRKRREEEQVVLYVCKRSSAYFSKRLNQIESTIDFYKRFEKNIRKLHCRNSGTEGAEDKQYNDMVDIHPYDDISFCLGNVSTIPIDEKYLLASNLYEKSINYGQLMEQQEIIDAIMSDQLCYQNAKKICYFERGCIALNSFSIRQCFELRKFYKEMIDKMESDSFAFIKQQAKWLQLNVDYVEKALTENDKEIAVLYRENLKKSILPWLDKEMSMEESEKWKLTFQNEIIYFLKKTETYKEADAVDIRKPLRPIGKPKFNKCMIAAGLPFKMTQEKGNDKPYIIRRIECVKESKESPASEQ